MFRKLFRTFSYLGGRRLDNTYWYWYPQVINSFEATQYSQSITAVCGVIQPKEALEKIIVIKNSRGYDLPGGHVEPHEHYLNTFHRELREEANATIINTLTPFAILHSDKETPKKTAVLFCKGIASMGSFYPNTEIFERKLMTPEDFLACYGGNKALMDYLLKVAFPKLEIAETSSCKRGIS